MFITFRKNSYQLHVNFKMALKANISKTPINCTCAITWACYVLYEVLNKLHFLFWTQFPYKLSLNNMNIRTCSSIWARIFFIYIFLVSINKTWSTLIVCDYIVEVKFSIFIQIVTTSLEHRQQLYHQECFMMIAPSFSNIILNMKQVKT